MRISGYWEKIPFSVLQLHILIYNSFYGLCIDTWLNESSLLILNFSFIAFVLRWKANFLIKELIVSFLMISCMLLFFFEKYGLHAFQNGLKLQSTLSFSKYCSLAYFFRLVNRFRCHLNLTMLLGFFDMFLRHDLIIICFRRALLKWVFWFPRKIFVFLGAWSSKTET